MNEPDKVLDHKVFGDKILWSLNASFTGVLKHNGEVFFVATPVLPYFRVK